MTKRILVALLAVAGLCAPAWAGPTLEDLSKIGVDRALQPPAIKTIGDYLEACVEQFRSAKTPENLAKARQAFLDGYAAHAEPVYQIEYARVAGEKLTPLLTLPDAGKQVQVARLIASMQQMTIQPALEAMATSASAAVRYWAAKGYGTRNTMRAVMAQGAEASAKMMATLEKLGLQDKSPQVFAMVVSVLNPSPDFKKEQNAQLQALQDKIWLARLKDVRAGRADMAEAYAHAAEMLLAEPDQPAPVLQMLTDALEAGSLALLSPEVQGNEQVFKTVADLLVATEGRLAEVGNFSRLPVQAILGKENKTGADEKKFAADKATEVRLTINDTWKKLLQDKGIAPRVTASATSSATTGATRGTTATAPK